MHWSAWLPRPGRPTDPADVGRPERCSVDASPADDCLAFLAGALAEYRMDHDQIVSTWEWMNLLAHGAEDDLRGEVTRDDEVQSSMSTPARGNGWTAARSYLASELLDLVERSGSLIDVQRSALVPLELEMACDPRVTGWRPHEWVRVVDSVLSSWRSGTRYSICRRSHLRP